MTTRRAFVLGSLAFTACATNERRRVVREVLPSPAPRPDPGFALVSTPSGWQDGRVDAPGILRRPTLAWTTKVGGPVTLPIRTDGARFYVISGGRLDCLDRSGQRAWTIGAGAATPVEVGPFGLAMGTTTGGMLLLDPTNGVTVRSHTAGGTMIGGPVMLDAHLAWVTIDGVVGSTAGWAAEFATSSAGPLATDGDRWFLASLEGELICGRGAEVLWRRGLGGVPAAGPSLDRTGVYVPVAGRGGDPGAVVAFEREGAPRWSTPMPGQPTRGLAVGSAVYVADRRGAILALDPRSGREVWATDLGTPVTNRPALTRDEQIYLTTADGRFVRLYEDGGQAWDVPVGASISGDPALVAGLAVLGTVEGNVLALAEGT